ncbi:MULTISPECIES: PilZ domain-containing protein [unclassified Rhizobium]|uniref:PilZ domain-containing protein n=1 Tax=unclassified Rhizobium TaxID=2613769 RepID=UPI0009EABA06|nr:MULTISPECIES: PilZ domain-containing protein [unclassified Rhizobium]
MTELRRQPRMKTYKFGRVIFNDGRSTVDCILRNISDHGAKLSFNVVPAIPDRFRLTFSDGTTRSCSVAWRKSLDVGVSFMSVEDAPVTAPHTGETP